MPRKLIPPSSGKYDIMCPYCESEFVGYLKNGTNYVGCKNCQKEIKIFLATVRAKRGRTRSKGEYIIRAITDEGEHVLEFFDYDYRDLDLRSRDVFYISYNREKQYPGYLVNVTTDLAINVGKAYERHEKMWEQIHTSRQKSKCFIATAAYGTSLCSEIMVLRKFRDINMLPNPFLKNIVKLYYRTSPPIAKIIARNDQMRKVTRFWINLSIKKIEKIVEK